MGGRECFKTTQNNTGVERGKGKREEREGRAIERRGRGGRVQVKREGREGRG